MLELERIAAAAIKVGQVVYTGPHHASIIHQVVACGGETPVKGEQGFVTSFGYFVNRATALRVAIAAGQVDPVLGHNPGLMSENLWSVPERETLLTKLLLGVRLEGTEENPCWSVCAIELDLRPGRPNVDGHVGECADARAALGIQGTP